MLRNTFMTFLFPVFLYFLIENVLAQTNVSTVNVPTQYGTVVGQVIQTTSGFRMRLFRRIPYAQTPPSSRFARTVPLTRFNSNPHNAVPIATPCARWGTNGKTFDPNSSEDCLYLKILVPDSATCCLPVMFWPNGGGFNDGAISLYDNNALGNNFVSKGVVVVQVQYRQGPLGFFTTGTSDAPGNMGIWDSLEALRFVQNIIVNFNGDRNRITIMGHEAGAVMAELLSLTPLSFGYYSQLVLIGHSLFDPKVIKNDQVNIDRSQRLARLVNCDDATRNLWTTGRRAQVLSCMRTVAVSQLISAIGRSDIAPAEPGNSLYNFFWRPRVDGLLYTDTFENMALRRPVLPTLVGAQKDSWLSEILPFVVRLTSNNAVLPNNFSTTYNTQAFVTTTCNNLLTDAAIYTSQLRSCLSAACINRYAQTGIQDPTDPYYYVHRAGRVATGFHVLAPLAKTVNYMRATGNRQVYIYSFDYDRSFNGSLYQALGAYNPLDIQLLENFFPFFTFDGRDNATTLLFSELLTNFVRFGNPTPVGYGRVQWDTFGSTNCYLSINLPPVMRQSFYPDDVNFFMNTCGGLRRVFV